MELRTTIQCLVVDDDELSRTIVEHFVAQDPDLELVGSCETGVEAIHAIRHNPVDLIFLDIEMPHMTGLELARAVRGEAQIILVTSKEGYAAEAFEIGTTDYLVKPVNFARFHQAVERVRERMIEGHRPEQPANSDYVFFRVDGRLVKTDLRSIRFIEAKGDYVMVNTTERQFLVHSTMKNMEEQLSTTDFARAHRSFIVRIDKIDDVADSTLVLGRNVIPLGPSHRTSLLAKLRTI